jgi:membrane AbrB-like protein
LIQETINLIVLLGLGYIAAIVSMKLKVPAGRLIGPILLIAFLKILGLNIYAPSFLVMLCSIILGVFIGLKFNKESFNQLKSVIKPGIVLMFWFVFITFAYGWLLLQTSFLDRGTAFLSVVPGGIAEVSVLALSYNANISQIVSFQLARLLAIVLIVPLIVKRVFVYHGEHYCEKTAEKEKTGDLPAKKNNYWMFLVVGTVGSIVFTLINFPAGRLVGALLFIAAYNLSPFLGDNVSPPPVSYYNYAQIGMGSIIGTNFTRESFLSIPDLIFPILLMTFLILFSSLVLSWIFGKVFKWDFLTCFLGIIPGGLAPMVLIADQVNADVIVVSSLQLLRLLTAILVIPVVYSFFL